MLTKRTTTIFLLAIVMVGVFGFFVPAEAQILEGFAENFIAEAFLGIFRLVILISGAFIAIAAGLLNVVLKIDFIPEFVRDVWTTFRDFANIGFIVFLIVASFGTIFNISGWTYREMLAPGLVAALLINFSYPISEFIFSFANQFSKMLLFVIGDVSFVFAGGISLQKFSAYGASFETLQGGLAGGLAQIVPVVIFLSSSFFIPPFVADSVYCFTASPLSALVNDFSVPIKSVSSFLPLSA